MKTIGKRFRKYTREEKRQFAVKVCLIISIIIWAIFIVFTICGPVVNRYFNTNEEKIIMPTVTVMPQAKMYMEQENIEINISQDHAEMLARLAWGEARGCTTKEQAAVMWCVLNRVDSDNSYFRDTIEETITQPDQFYYSSTFPVEDHLLELSYHVLECWYMEKETGEINADRVLPKEYCYFGGDGVNNWFRNAYRFENANIWDWSWGSPYGD